MEFTKDLHIVKEEIYDADIMEKILRLQKKIKIKNIKKLVNW